MEELRGSVEAARARSRERRLSKLGAESLTQAFDDLAPEGLRFDLAGTTTMAVSPGSEIGRPTGRDLSSVIEHFARAVAAIGREIREPHSRFTPLTRADYLKAPIFTTIDSQGRVLIKPQAPDLWIDDQQLAKISETALERLADLLPRTAQDRSAIEGSLGARVPSRRAIREVADAARRVNGLTLQLISHGRETDAVVTGDQADQIHDTLDFDEVEVEPIRETGVLDGAWESKRRFYLEREGAPTIEGVIDESMVDTVFALLRTRVIATIERTTHVTRAGVQGRAGYRLVAILPLPDEPALFQR